MDALDVEGAQALLDEIRELGGKRRALDVVVADQEVNRIRGAAGDLRADGGGRRRAQNASRIALTMVRANSVLMRSRALVSCWKKATGSAAVRLLPES